MSKQIPYFKFFSGEWLLGRISDENYRVQGLFISACSFYWHKECVITHKELSKKLGKTNVKLLQECDYLQIENEHIIIKFLDEQYSEFEDLREKRSKAGQKGGQASVKQRLTNDKPIVNHLEIDKEKELDIDKEKSKIIFPFDSKEFLKCWELWVKYRSQSKKPIKGQIAAQAQLKKISDLAKNNEELAIKIIMQSIENNWQGLFELKQQHGQNNKSGANQNGYSIEQNGLSKTVSDIMGR